MVKEQEVGSRWRAIDWDKVPKERPEGPRGVWLTQKGQLAQEEPMP